MRQIRSEGTIDVRLELGKVDIDDLVVVAIASRVGAQEAVLEAGSICADFSAFGG